MKVTSLLEMLTINRQIFHQLQVFLICELYSHVLQNGFHISDINLPSLEKMDIITYRNLKIYRMIPNMEINLWLCSMNRYTMKSKDQWDLSRYTDYVSHRKVIWPLTAKKETQL